MLFGICTLVMDVFKTGYYSSFLECQSAIKILHPLTQAVFVIVQVGGGMGGGGSLNVEDRNQHLEWGQES